MSAKKNLIDQKFLDACEKLKAFDRQLNDNFLKLTTNFDRFKFISCIGFMSKELEPIFEKYSFNPKDDEKAALYRKEGNESYKEKKFYEALLKYNQSIRYASQKTKQKISEIDENKEIDNDLALAYANRSAVFFHINEFELCLNDINTSFRFDYPTKLKQKLIERKVNCLFQLDRINDIVTYLKNETSINKEWMNDFLKKIEEIKKEEEQEQSEAETKKHVASNNLFKNYGKIKFEIDEQDKNNRILSGSKSITIDYSVDQGIFLKATNKIEVGDVIVDELPYASVLLGEYAETHCSECMILLNILKMNISNCRQCSRVIYCSSQCEKKAWKSHHQHECKYFNLLADQAGITHMEWLALRIVLKAGLDYLKSVKTILYTHERQFENFKRDEESMKTIKEINEVYKSDSYLTIFNLITNSGLRSTNDLFRRGFVSLFFVKLLVKTGFFKDSNCQKEDELFIGGLILRHLQSISCNAHEISRLKLGFSPKKAMETSTSIGIGAGIYAVLSLFNHSCDPSVTRYFRGNRCQVRAIKNINKNEEIFDNYGYVFAVNEITERQEKLFSQYFFQCTCIACMNEWPKYDKLESDLNLVRNQLRCDSCIKKKISDNECTDCQRQLDNLLLEQLTAQQNLKALLKFNLSTDIEDEPVMLKLEDIFESFCNYLKKLEFKCVKRPFQDYNSYQEGLKQCINFINRY